MYTGGIKIDPSRLHWSAPTTLVVPFTSVHMLRHQLYAGARLLSETRSGADRQFAVSYQPSRYPEFLQIVALSTSEPGGDRSADLPPRPRNRVRVTFTNTGGGWSGDPHEVDVRIFELFLAQEPGGEIDAETAVAAVVAEGVRTYELLGPPVGPSGTWPLIVRGRDTREEGGNPGSEEAGSAEILAVPPDFETEFGVTVSGGLATFNVTVPED